MSSNYLFACNINLVRVTQTATRQAFSNLNVLAAHQRTTN